MCVCVYVCVCVCVCVCEWVGGWMCCAFVGLGGKVYKMRGTNLVYQNNIQVFETVSWTMDKKIVCIFDIVYTVHCDTIIIIKTD